MFNYNEIDILENLFIILKLYYKNDLFIIRNVYSIIYEENNKIGILQGLSYNKIFKSSFNSFSIYYNNFIENDEKYICENNIYGIRLMFYKNSPIFNTQMIYPKYPWDDNYIKLFDL